MPGLSPPGRAAEQRSVARRARRVCLGAALFVGPLLAGCGDGAAETNAAELPWAVGEWPSYSPPDAAQAQLGKLLFYDPVLGADGTTACATCHSEHWGMGDGLPVSVGLDGVGAVGPGRDGVNRTRRNSQSLWNVAFRQRLFWDGRSPSLEEQVLSPLTEAVELGSSAAAVEEAIRGVPEYLRLFDVAFPGEPFEFTLVQRALAAYQRLLVSDYAPYDRYVAGDLGALNERSLRGMRAFGREGCADCHVPPRFELDRYVDRGHSGPDDLGRGEVTGDAADVGAFRVPSLRNLRETEPYFHAGTVPSIAGAVRAEIARDRGVEPSSVPQDIVDDIAYFLNKALIDRTRDQPRPAHVPSGLPVPLDGFRVPR